MVFMSSNYSNQQGLSDQDWTALNQEFWVCFDRAIDSFQMNQHEYNELERMYQNPNTFNEYYREFSDGRFFRTREVERSMYTHMNNWLAENRNRHRQSQQQFSAPQQGHRSVGTGSPLMRSPLITNSAFANTNSTPRNMGTPGQVNDNPVTLADHLMNKSVTAQRENPQQVQRSRVLSQEEVYQTPKIHVVQIKEDVELLTKFTAVEKESEHPKAELVKVDLSVNFKHPKYVQWNSVTLTEPCVSAVQAIRILKNQCPSIFNIPQWIVYLDYDQLTCESIVGKENNIGEAFKILAEKASIVNDIDTFMSVMVPALKAMSGENGIIDTKLKNIFNQYMINYFRNPLQPTVYHQIQSWIDLNEILNSTSADMQPWTQIEAKYPELIWKFLYSSMNSVLQWHLPEGSRISSENQQNAGMFASIAKLQLSEGKHLLRDYGNMSATAWKKMSAKLDEKYVLYKTKCRIIVTNLNESDIIGDSESPLTIVPYNYIFNPIHVVANTVISKSNTKEGQILPLCTVIKYDDSKDEIEFAKDQGTLIGSGLIYF